MTKIPEIKAEIWTVLTGIIKNNYSIDNFFSLDIGKELIEKILDNQDIARYQWNYESNGIHNLLEHYYLKNFFFDMKLFLENNSIKINFENSKDFASFFNLKFEQLEIEILLSPSFRYILLIPTFRILFPKDTKTIELDDRHFIKNINDEDQPYNEDYNINNFKELPKFWPRIREDPPNASFEVIFEYKKRLANEKPYYGYIPPAPMNSDQYICPIFEKVKSIYDFFLVYHYYPDNVIFTFGENYYIILPPYSTHPKDPRKNISKESTINYFPLSHGYLSLKETEKKDYWKDKWNLHYQKFYSKFYTDTEGREDLRVFKYTFDVLRTLRRIIYPQVKNFLLISTLEGLLYKEEIGNKLGFGNYNKKDPVADTFIAISEAQGKFWQHIFQIKYPLTQPLNSFSTKNDLREFIICTFNYRNNIAHPEKKIPTKIKPSYLQPISSFSTEECTLNLLITDNFPLFLIFLIRTWINEKCKNIDDWYKYLKGLVNIS